MRIPRQEEPQGGIINLESLLDVIFILLVFYVATAEFREEERDVNVRLTDTSLQQSTLSSKKKLIVINVYGADRAGEDPPYVVSGKRVSLRKIRKMAEDARKRDPGQKVLVRGDEMAYHGNVARAVNQCRLAGIKEVNIGYDYKPTE